MSGATTYTGATTVAGGRLVLSHPLTTSSSVTIQSGAAAELQQGGAATLLVPTLSIAGTTNAWSGKLDIKDNDVILRSSPANRLGDFARVTNQLKQGANFSGAAWTGNGIVTSLGGDGASGFTAVGVAINDYGLLGGVQTGPLFTSFDGQSVGVNDVLLKYTYFGDADLNGQVNSNDYFQIDTGFLNNRTGWINGDFDYDGAVTSNDYFLIDNAFLHPGPTLVPHAADASAAASVTAVPEPGTIGIAALGAAFLLGRRSRRRGGCH
jgi:hypothetical protein